VKIKANDLETKQIMIDKRNSIQGGPNLQICDPDLGMMSILDMYGEIIKVKYVYHLITDKKTFHINGVRFYDYNSCIDKYLDLENNKLVKALV